MAKKEGRREIYRPVPPPSSNLIVAVAGLLLPVSPVVLFGSNP